ncbi:uncharacterized protein LOC129218942 [Uloborus diversus]|uniref:uncharacterized protein LOC129218942 n=1 Tax=Uloborus diversus TaxID=327109 RepID=UPI00240A2291|nr:uncharacterized protein LOC129218942 [Uloborus diversus]
MVLADLGPQFTAEVFNAFKDLFRIQLRHTCSGNPKANCLSERINSSIKSSVNALMAQNKSFEYAIAVHKAIYNATMHSTTKTPPNVLHFGRNLSLLTDTIDVNIDFSLNAAFELHKILDELKVIYDRAYQNTLVKRRRQNARQAPKAKLRTFQKGDLVYLKSKDKFKPSYGGPYCILKMISNVVAVIQKSNIPNSHKFKVHIDKILLVPPRAPHLSNINETNGNPSITAPTASTPPPPYNPVNSASNLPLSSAENDNSPSPIQVSAPSAARYNLRPRASKQPI